MQVYYTSHFKKDYKGLPIQIQEKIDKTIEILLNNPKHPSLRFKKMRGEEDIWEASITMHYRFTFQIQGDIFILRRIGTHDILKNP